MTFCYNYNPRVFVFVSLGLIFDECLNQFARYRRKPLTVVFPRPLVQDKLEVLNKAGLSGADFSAADLTTFQVSRRRTLLCHALHTSLCHALHTLLCHALHTLLCHALHTLLVVSRFTYLVVSSDCVI